MAATRRSAPSSAGPGAPVIRVRIYTLMGGASVYRSPAGPRPVAEEARRLADGPNRRAAAPGEPAALD